MRQPRFGLAATQPFPWVGSTSGSSPGAARKYGCCTDLLLLELLWCRTVLLLVCPHHLQRWKRPGEVSTCADMCGRCELFSMLLVAVCQHTLLCTLATAELHPLELHQPYALGYKVH
jgi:hypothetical protein